MPRFPEILNTSEAASFLHTHVESVRRMARRGEIPSFKTGKDWRFRREELRAFTTAAPSSSSRRLVPSPIPNLTAPGHTQQSLRDSEEKFRALAENSTDVIMRFDRQFRHLYVNSCVEAQTGIRAQDFIGRTHAELGFPESLVTLWEAQLRKTMECGVPNRIEFQLPNQTWIDWLLVPELDADGSVKGVMTAARDITRLKSTERELQEANDRLERRVEDRTVELIKLNLELQAEIRERIRIEEDLRAREDQLRESEKRLLLIANNLPGGMIYQIIRKADGTRRFAFISGSVERLHGCTAEEAMEDAARVYTTVVEEDRGRVMLEEEQALQSFSVFQTEVRIQKPSGEIGWSYFASNPRWMDDGSTCWDGLEIDITERKKAEGELRVSEERYRHLSLHDSLTGLFNRTAFMEYLAVIEHDFAIHAPVSISVLDVNRLKLINDTMGHAMGDRLLVTAADAIGRILPPNSTLFRTGGDEFCVVSIKARADDAQELRKRILVSATLAEDGTVMLGLGFSIGIACTDQHPGMSLFEILQCADDDMYQDKLINNVRSMGHIETLVAALDAHDYGAQGHIERVTRIVEVMADRLNLAETQKRNLILLARLHDLGKIGIQGKILHKKGPLNEQEKVVIRTHSEIGHRIATRSHDLSQIASLILHHHENWDGSGYPMGLPGEAIPLECRILSIADTFDAMTSSRPYSTPRSFDDAVVEIRSQAGAQFDPGLVAIFLEIFTYESKAMEILAEIDAQTKVPSTSN